MLQIFTSILSVALLLSLTALVSAEDDGKLLSKLNSNIELTKVTGKPVETLKTAETRSTGSTASVSGPGGSSVPLSSTELGGGRGPGPVNSPQAASSNSYQVSGENFAGTSGESQAQQNQGQSPTSAQQHQQASPDVYSSSVEDTSAVSSSPTAYGRLNEIEYNRAAGYPTGRALSHPYGSYEMNGQNFDLQRNPEPAYDNGASGEYSSSQSNVANENGYSMNQETSAYEDANSNEDEGNAYRTQEPEGSPVAVSGSGPENQENHQQNHHQQQQQQQQQQQPQQQVQASPEQGARKTSTLSSPGPVPDYGGFRPVMHSQNIATPPIPGPQRPYPMVHTEQYRSVSINYEPPKSVYSYDGLSNANTGSYNSKNFPVYGGGQRPRDAQANQIATPPNPHAGYGLDYGSGKPYGGDLSSKPYSADHNGNIKKVIPMTIGYDEFVKHPNPSAAQYHNTGHPTHHHQSHHGSEYVVAHGSPQHAYEQGPPQGSYGQSAQSPPPQAQKGPPQMSGGYGQPVTYQATPIGYAQPDAYDQQSGPVTYEQQPPQQGPPQAQQQGHPVNYEQQNSPVTYEQSAPLQQGPPQGHQQVSHPHPPLQHASGQLAPPQQVQQSPPVYGPPSGPGHAMSMPHPSGPPAGQYDSEPNYGIQSAAPVNYEQSGPGEYQQTHSKPGYEQTTTFVESSGYPGNLGPSYGTIKEGPGPLTAPVGEAARAPLEGYSGNMASENEYYPSSYDTIENSMSNPGPSNYPNPSLSGYNSQSNSYSSGGFSLPDDSYMQSLFGFPTYDVNSAKGHPYASGSNPIPSPASPGSHISGVSSSLTGSSPGKSPVSFLPSIKLTGNGIKFSGFGSSLTGGLGSFNQAIASTLGSGLSSVTGPGLGYGSGLGSSYGSSSSANGASLHPSGPSASSGLGGPLASFYNNFSGLGSPFGGLSGLNNYGAAASKLIPQAIRAPFRTMYRALMGANANQNPLNG